MYSIHLTLGIIFSNFLEFVHIIGITLPNFFVSNYLSIL